MTATTPWALRLATPRRPITPPGYTSVTLDPSTQTAVYRNSAGRVVEMGTHGTNKTQGTTTTSGGSDGGKPTPQSNDDNNVDYVSD